MDRSKRAQSVQMQEIAECFEGHCPNPVIRLPNKPKRVKRIEWRFVCVCGFHAVEGFRGLLISLNLVTNLAAFYCVLVSAF